MHDGSEQVGPLGSASVGNGEVADDQWKLKEAIIIREILAMNTLAMQKCETGALDEASGVLTDAYMKLHNDTATGESQGLDSVRATTLNNLGVVECHRGQHRQALSHFEAARQLEEAWSAASPSVALNSCAAYNALGMYDKATAAAMETINMLRRLFAQQELREASKDGTAATPGATRGAGPQSDGMNVANSDNAALWGAAWHNLAVAQINTAKSSTDLSEYTNAAALFQNSMRATQELLGFDHPMTKSVTETYRAVRNALRTHGVYRQHHTLLTVPLKPADPRDEADDMEQYFKQCGIKSRRRALEKYHRDLTITFCGAVTNGVKLTERLDPTPYPRAKDVSFRRNGTKDSLRMLRAIPTGGTIEKACYLYGNPHPLLFSLPRNYQSPQAGSLNGVRDEESGNFPAKVAVRPGALASSRSPAPNRHRMPKKVQSQPQPSVPKRALQPVSAPSAMNGYSPMPQSTPRGISNAAQGASIGYQRASDERWQQPVNQVFAYTDYSQPFRQQMHKSPAQQEVAVAVLSGHSASLLPMPQTQNPGVSQQWQPPVYQAKPPAAVDQRLPNTVSSVPQQSPFDYQQGQPPLLPFQYQASNELTQGFVAGHRPPQEFSAGNPPVVVGQGVWKKGVEQATLSAPPTASVLPTPVDGRKPAAIGRGILPPLRTLPTNTPATNNMPDGAEETVGAQCEPSSEGHAPTHNARKSYEQMKYILLADPPSEAPTRKSKQERSKKDTAPVSVPQQECVPWTEPPDSMGGEPLGEQKPHRLFDALWVSAPGSIEPAPTRVVGKPSYFVSSVIDMRQDQVVLPEEVVQMVAENSSTCSDEDERYSQTIGPPPRLCSKAGSLAQEQ